MNHAASNADDGYRHEPLGGARLRADVIDVYVFRACAHNPGAYEVLQLLRATPPMDQTWQPVMGHVEEGEHAAQCALRELSEEVGLAPNSQHILGLWALEQVHPYYLPDLDCVVLSPRFAVQVSPEWTPVLNREHTDSRWVAQDRAASMFMWPGQIAAVSEIMRHIAPPDALSREKLRIDPSRLGAR